MYKNLLNQIIPDIDDLTENLSDLSYPPEIEEAMEDAARCRGEAIERDESQTQSLKEISNKMDESSKSANRAFWTQFWLQLFTLIAAVAGLAIGIAALIKT